MKWTMVVGALFAARALAGVPECQASLSAASFAKQAVEDRAVIAIATVAEDCVGVLSSALQKNLNAIVYQSPEDRPRSLGNTSGDEEARADFEAACPGWAVSPLATQFVGGKAVTVDVFKQCKFDRFGVLSAAEFAKAEVHFATMAVVVFHALTRAGIDAQAARKVVRVFALPLDAGAPPPPKPSDDAWLERVKQQRAKQKK